MRARSVGGPPDGHWERNGLPIREDGKGNFTIRFEVDTSSQDAYQEGRYNSFLVAKGRYPGEYSYWVTNRITDRVFSENLFIEGIHACA